ncbi:MAG: zinc-ribbon domain-containing protein, partial [Burkholderiaceae bacterium]|nr:zinc-ribbon domain-containing protein [Burkholderiaceae bacterium]
MLTRCPQCQSVFNVSEEQLKRYGGLVQCGVCQQTFNGIHHLQDKPSPVTWRAQPLPQQPAPAPQQPAPAPQQPAPAPQQPAPAPQQPAPAPQQPAPAPQQLAP